MNYKRIHDQIIDRAKSRTLPKDTYTERHHIVPRCLGGNDSKDNLVKLTAREHYLIHWLLYKIHKTPKLAYAWSLMIRYGKNHTRYTSHTFEYARRAHSIASSVINKNKDHSGENNPMYGKKHSIATKRLLSVSKTGTNHPMYGKTGHNSGKVLSKETRYKMHIAAQKRIACNHCEYILVDLVL